MDSNPLEDALAGGPGEDQSVETAPEPVEAVAEPQTPPEAPARGPDGKFAAKAPAAAAPPQDPQSPEPAHVPIGAMLDERDKRKSLEKQLAEFKAREAEAQRAAAAAPATATAEDQVQAQRYADNLRFSRRFAEREYGKDLIAAVHDWASAQCDADPHFNAKMRASDDPYEAAVQAYNRDQLAAKVTPEAFAAFEAWQAAQAEVQAGQPAQPTQPAAPPPPRSLAHAPGTGLRGKPSVEEGQGSAFGAAFG